MPRVPTTADVLPGASVNIVLKADQPTGRTVTGIVSNLLTRGNHPRGIKVRLTDGRVGRVQSMAVAGTVTATSTAASVAQSATPATVQSGLPSERIGLDAYIVTRGKRQRNTKGDADQATESALLDGPQREDTATTKPTSETATCPVCGDFDGDEAAVAHHVASHFDN